MPRPPLDELMIVNPGSPETTTVRRVRTGCAARQVARWDPNRRRLFLGATGHVYELTGRRSDGLGRYFLGADGTLYEIDR